MTRKSPDPRSERLLTITSVALAVTSLAVAVLAATSNTFEGSGVGVSIPWWMIAAVPVVFAYAGFTAWMLTHLRRVRHFDFRLAITGQPGSGKTVFANLLYERCMNDRNPYVSFTADSRSAIAVYQAIRGIDQGAWPQSTGLGNVIQYDGELQFGKRTVVDLEIGDTAGEHWLDLATEGSDGAPGFLEYVVSARSIAHIISIEDLYAESHDAARSYAVAAGMNHEVQDLRLAAQLARSVERHNGRALLVILSKVDLIIPDRFSASTSSELFRVFHSKELPSSKILREMDRLGDHRISERLTSLAAELQNSFDSVDFCFSSTRTLQGGQSVSTSEVSENGIDVLEWIYGSSQLRWG